MKHELICNNRDYFMIVETKIRNKHLTENCSGESLGPSYLIERGREKFYTRGFP